MDFQAFRRIEGESQDPDLLLHLARHLAQDDDLIQRLLNRIVNDRIAKERIHGKDYQD